MSRLRFTNLGETGATGGDKGIWGRLGEPGRPVVRGARLRAPRRAPAARRRPPGAQGRAVRRADPVPRHRARRRTCGSRTSCSCARATARSCRSCRSCARTPRGSAAGSRCFDSARDYFATLFEHGVTPLRLATDEERSKLNEMLRTSMTGGISRALTSELRGFLLKEEARARRHAAAHAGQPRRVPAHAHGGAGVAAARARDRRRSSRRGRRCSRRRSCATPRASRGAGAPRGRGRRGRRRGGRSERRPRADVALAQTRGERGLEARRELASARVRARVDRHATYAATRCSSGGAGARCAADARRGADEAATSRQPRAPRPAERTRRRREARRRAQGGYARAPRTGSRTSSGARGADPPGRRVPPGRCAGCARPRTLPRSGPARAPTPSPRSSRRRAPTLAAAMQARARLDAARGRRGPRDAARAGMAALRAVIRRRTATRHAEALRHGVAALPATDRDGSRSGARSRIERGAREAARARGVGTGRARAQADALGVASSEGTGRDRRADGL